jgi:hypothetical protein
VRLVNDRIEPGVRGRRRPIDLQYDARDALSQALDVAEGLRTVTGIQRPPKPIRFTLNAGPMIVTEVICRAILNPEYGSLTLLSIARDWLKGLIGYAVPTGGQEPYSTPIQQRDWLRPPQSDCEAALTCFSDRDRLSWLLFAFRR